MEIDGQVDLNHLNIIFTVSLKKEKFIHQSFKVETKDMFTIMKLKAY